MRSGGFCWFDVKTRDVGATSEFFSAALGWKIAVDPDDWRRSTRIALDGAFTDWPDTTSPPARRRHLGERPAGARRFYEDVLGVRAEFAAGDAGWEVAVHVSDTAAVARQVAALGTGACERTTGPVELRLTDPQGLRIGVLRP